MSNNRRETLEDRIAKRRRLRDKKFGKNSIDETELILLHSSPTVTRSLDRQSSKRVSQLSRLASVTEHKPLSNSNSLLQQNYPLTDDKPNSPPTVPHGAKKQSFESDNEKETTVPIKTEKSNSISQKSPPQTDEKSVAIKETVPPIGPPRSAEKSISPQQNEKPLNIRETTPPILTRSTHPTTIEKSEPVQQKIHPQHDEKPAITKETHPPIPVRSTHPATTEKTHSYQDEKSVNTKETHPPIPVRSNHPAITEKTHSYQDEKPVVTKETHPPIPVRSTHPGTTHQDEKPVVVKQPHSSILPSIIPLTITEKSQPEILKRRSQNSPNQSVSHPQSSTDPRPNHFHFPACTSKPLSRTKSEQIVPKQRSIDPTFSRPDSLALAYLFNKRIMDAELSHTSSASSSSSKQLKQKTIWD